VGDNKKILIFGRLEYAGMDACGHLHMEISKRSVEVGRGIVSMLKAIEGKDVLIKVEVKE